MPATPRRFQPTILVWIALAAIVLIGLNSVRALHFTRPEQPNAATAPPLSPNDPAWVAGLVAGDRVEFVRQDATGTPSKELGTLQSLGPLTDSEIERVRGALSLELSWQEVLKAQTKAELTGDASDYQYLLEQLFVHAKHEVALRMLKSGEYVTMKGYTTPPTIADNYAVLAFRGIASRDQKPADVWFFIDMTKESEVHQAWEIQQEGSERIAQEAADVFNRRPFEERRARIMAHDDARKNIGNLIRTGGPDGKLAADALRHQLLPNGFQMDRERWVLSPYRVSWR